MSGIYIHVPFCKQACSYCDFYFVTRQENRPAYVEALLKEIRSYEGTPYIDDPVETIYFGGGTPSLLSSQQIESILSAICDVFRVKTGEVTLEMNPDDVTADYLQDLQHVGINRASMGVQSFQQELLAFMHRAHNRDEALKCLELLRQSGFDAFTVDLIYGNPGQTCQDLLTDLETLLAFDPPHVSAYSLTVEENTALGKKVELGRITPPPDESVATQFGLIGERLKEQGIHRYEISNYSKPGFEARHNSNYWQHENYLGFGPGAHSFWWNGQPRRWQNETNLSAYLDSPGKQKRTETLSLHQLAEERLMLGLRTRSGVSTQLLDNHYNYQLNDEQDAYLDRLEQNGKLRYGESVQLTEQGMLLADAITLDIISF